MKKSPLLQSFRLSFCFSLLFSAGATVYERATYAASLGETSARISCTPTAAESIKRLKGFQKIEWSIRRMNGPVPGAEQIIVFSDNSPSNEFREDGFDFDRKSGDLLAKFSPLTIDDNAIFSCSLTLEQGTDSQDTKLVVFSAPPETERKPDVFKVSDPRDYAEFTFLENSLASQITEVALCRSGYAAPEPEISWVIEDQSGNTVREIDINSIRTDDFEDFFVDFDNSLGKHGTKEVDLPLKIHLSSEYHLHKFKCIVTYQLAGENHEVVTKSYERQFPPRDVIRVVHPVSSVYLVKNGAELGDVVDIGDPSALQIECQSNGYDPAQEADIKMVPSAADLRQEVEKCAAGKKAVCEVTVTCSAKNSLNDKEVIQSFPLSLTRFPEFKCQTVENELFRLTDQVEVRCIPARISDELEVSWYASPSEKLGGDGLVKKLERSASEIGASPSGRVFLPPNVPHVAVVSIAGQNYKKAEFFTPVKEDKRAPSAATIEDGERGVGGKWIAVENPFSGERVGANSISFWKFHQHSHQFTRIDSSSQEKLTNGVNRLGVEPATASRFVKDPVGGDYTACYDIFNDADSIIMNRSFRTFEAAANIIHARLNSPEGEFKQCRFYSVKEREGYWWLWIIIIVILLIFVAIGAIFLRIRSDNNEDEDLYSKIEEPLEGPSVIAVQTETAADTRAEFTYKVHIKPIAEMQDSTQIPSGPSTHPPITCSSESEVDESEEENSNNSPCFNEQTPMLR